MQDGLNLPFICAATPMYFTKWFAWFREILNQPYLEEEEKFLGLWLADQFANDMSLSCLYNYEQISQAVNKPLSRIHRILMRLRLMGYIAADIKLHYGELTPGMLQKTYIIKLALPLVKPKFIVKEEDIAAERVIHEEIIPPHELPTTFNLLKNYKPKSKNKISFLFRFFKRKKQKSDNNKEHPNE